MPNFFVVSRILLLMEIESILDAKKNLIQNAAYVDQSSSSTVNSKVKVYHYRSKRVRDRADSSDSEEESSTQPRSTSYNYWKKFYSFA